jgi:hypothetical protein
MPRGCRYENPANGEASGLAIENMAETPTDQYVLSLPPQKDGPLLHFLKELPGWCIVGVFLVAFTTLWIVSHDDFVPRILDALMGAFLGLVVAQRPRPTFPADSTPQEQGVKTK